MTQSEVRIIVPEPHYTLFNTSRDGRPEVIVINDALLAFPHADIFPWYLRITIEAHDLIDNGMPSEPESELLFDLGDEIEDVVLNGRTEHGGKNALFLARSTWNAVRELRYQIHDPEITDQALKQLLSGREWQRPWDYEMRADQEWRHAALVFQLFPLVNGHDA